MRPKGYFDRTQKLFTLEQTMARLREITGADPLPQVYPDERNQPVKPITRVVTLPAGFHVEPLVLEWLEPMNHPNGEKTQVSAGGAYEVAGRRCPEGFIFIARHGLDVLGSFPGAQAARECCDAHYRRACSE
jgi:hypothetical protein